MPRVPELPRFSNPGHCIMFPGRRRDERGFYLFETVIDGPNGDVQVGISGEGLRTIALRHGVQFGIALREDLNDAVEVIDKLRAERDALQARVDELESQQERITGLVRDGFQVQRRVGRPPKKEGE